MINWKRLFVSATFLSLAVFLITGCQQQGSGIKKIKDITVSKEDQEAIDERVKDLTQIEEDRIGSVDFGGGVGDIAASAGGMGCRFLSKRCQ